jgi:hypothetical protein
VRWRGAHHGLGSDKGRSEAVRRRLLGAPADFNGNQSAEAIPARKRLERMGKVAGKVRRGGRGGSRAGNQRGRECGRRIAGGDRGSSARPKLGEERNGEMEGNSTGDSCCRDEATDVSGGGVVMRDVVVSDESINDGCGKSPAKPPDGRPKKPKPREAAVTSTPPMSTVRPAHAPRRIGRAPAATAPPGLGSSSAPHRSPRPSGGASVESVQHGQGTDLTANPVVLPLHQSELIMRCEDLQTTNLIWGRR